MEEATPKTNSVIGALESARSHYLYHLDLESYPSKDARLLRDEIDLVGQVIANERTKIEALEALLKICASLAQTLEPAQKSELQAAVERVKATMEHTPMLPLDGKGNGKSSNEVR